MTARHAAPVTPRPDASLENHDHPDPGVHGGALGEPAPLTADALRGKVVLVDFWEYTCINWIRTLPYVKAWHRDYADLGLVVIGVHAPEFEFGKRAENIDRESATMA